MDPVTLLILIAAVFIVWLIIRKLWQTITCTIRMLFYVIIGVVIFYVVGSALELPIINQIDNIISNIRG